MSDEEIKIPEDNGDQDYYIKTGRTRKPVDPEELAKLCTFGCTLRECAFFFNVSEDTIERRVKEWHDIKFAEFSDKMRDGARLQLRKLMWQKAKQGNTAMIIWLSKQKGWLGFEENMNVRAKGFKFKKALGK